MSSYAVCEKSVFFGSDCCSFAYASSGENVGTETCFLLNIAFLQAIFQKVSARSVWDKFISFKSNVAAVLSR